MSRPKGRSYARFVVEAPHSSGVTMLMEADTAQDVGQAMKLAEAAVERQECSISSADGYVLVDDDAASRHGRLTENPSTRFAARPCSEVTRSLGCLLSAPRHQSTASSASHALMTRTGGASTSSSSSLTCLGIRLAIILR